MAKIQTINITNFKAITDLKADFKGCTAIVTGGNNKGKSSFLRGITDRIRFIRPEVMVKKGEKEGRGEMTLTTGEKFIWEFDTSGRDKLTYITSEGRQSVTKELGAQFFPPVFDIDKFLQSPPKSQVKQLQQIIGLDFTDIDERYRKAYDSRTERNREAEIYHVKLEKMMKVEAVKVIDLTELQGKKEVEKTRLNNLYKENKAANDKTRKDFEVQKIAQDKAKQTYDKCKDALAALLMAGYKGNEVTMFIDSLDIPKLKEPTYVEEMPDRSELDNIDQAILTATETNMLAQKYNEYIDYKQETENAKDAAKEADELVKVIESERQRMIESAKMPEGISITPEGITVDGLPLDRNQISTSKLYTSALRIASMNLGEVRTLYFDASFLDKINLNEIEKWASNNDLQLLIERPDYDGGEITYELIEK